MLIFLLFSVYFFRVKLVREASEDGVHEAVYEISVPQMRDDSLRMTRSFGDFFLKQNTQLPADQQAVIAVPEFKIVTRTSR